MNLYEAVLKEMDGDEQLLSGEQCSKISMMMGEPAENIYLLILHHYITNCKFDKQNLIEGKETPYKFKFATKDGKGAKFSVSNLPDDLQRIIYRYLQMILF